MTGYFSMPPSAWRMAVAACMSLTGAGCASLPDAALEMETPHTQVVMFEGARGPVSAGRSAAIIDKLEGASGDIDILQKHLALEQAINLDSPLVLGNKLTLLEDGPGDLRGDVRRHAGSPRPHSSGNLHF